MHEKQAKIIVLFLFCSFNPNEKLSKLCTELWELDEQRLVIGKDVVIDLQGRMSDCRLYYCTCKGENYILTF